jgi:hypothetical protein
MTPVDDHGFMWNVAGPETVPQPEVVNARRSRPCALTRR